MNGKSYINGIPIDQISEEESMEIFNRIIIKAAHSIGLRFTKEEENYPETYELKHRKVAKASSDI